MEHDFFYHKQTDKSFDEALSDLKKSIETHGFSVLSVIDMRERFQSIGKTSAPMSIVQLCNASLAFHAVSISKKMICMMPKDINIYTDDNGKVTMIFMRGNPDMLEKSFPGQGLPEMSQNIGAVLKQIIDDAV